MRRGKGTGSEEWKEREREALRWARRMALSSRARLSPHADARAPAADPEPLKAKFGVFFPPSASARARNAARKTESAEFAPNNRAHSELYLTCAERIKPAKSSCTFIYF